MQTSRQNPALLRNGAGKAAPVLPRNGAGKAATALQKNGVAKAAAPVPPTAAPTRAPTDQKNAGMDALGDLICRINPYTRLPTNQNTGLSTGLMEIGMLPAAQTGYVKNNPDHTIASMGIEVERQYKPVWSFKGQDQTVQAAVRIPYRFPVYGDDGTQLLYWQTEYLLLGYVGGGGMG
jgi:hypothetical protein